MDVNSERETETERKRVCTIKKRMKFQNSFSFCFSFSFYFVNPIHRFSNVESNKSESECKEKSEFKTPLSLCFSL